METEILNLIRLENGLIIGITSFIVIGKNNALVAQAEALYVEKLKPILANDPGYATNDEYLEEYGYQHDNEMGDEVMLVWSHTVEA